MGADLAFPEGFLWGAATSAHQVEGHNVHNDWWAWEQAGKVKESSGAACDQYRRFAGDFDLAASLGHNAHRLSIEWSRIEPAEGQWDDAALAHYAEVLQALRNRRLEPVVTLHHFTTPQWLARQGGWTHPKVVDRFARYAERVAHALDGLVRYWVTINEPMVYVNMHYVEGLGPPGAHDLKLGLHATQHLIRAHAAAYRALHAAASATADPATGTPDSSGGVGCRPPSGGLRGAPGVPGGLHSPPPVQVSIAKAVPVFVPCRLWWPPDLGVSLMTDRLFNTAFIDAVTEGRWSVPGLGTWRIPEAQATLDYLGLNYYTREFVQWDWRSHGSFVQRCDNRHHRLRIRERSDFGWDVSPRAFTYAVSRWAPLRLPILVTENGTYMHDDARRWRFIVRHLAALHRAMGQGVSVFGYLYWSLLDNFEWAHGFRPRFGLVEVDFATQERRVRDSARGYADVCRTNRLSLPSA